MDGLEDGFKLRKAPLPAIPLVQAEPALQLSQRVLRQRVQVAPHPTHHTRTVPS